MSEHSDAVVAAVQFALRHIDSATEAEREEILVACAEVFSGEAGEAAARTVHHLREQRAHQLQLKGLVFGNR